MSDVDHLTEIYMDVSEGAESTTEHQQEQEQRGSWNPAAEAETRIRETVEEIQQRYGLQTQLSHRQLVTLVEAFFDGASDTAIARELGDASLDKTVTRARLGLHLFRESDTTAEFDLEDLQECFAADNTGTECARRLDIGKSTANRYRRIFEAKDQAQQVDNEYYERFRRYCRGDGGDTARESDYAMNDGLDDVVADAGAENPQLQ